jgi:hypothetical protein
MSQQWNAPPPPISGPGTINNNLALSIVALVVSLFFCCLPHGLGALIFALQVDKKAQAGDYQGALSAAKTAKTWSIASIIVSVIGLAISLFLGILNAVLQSVR